jgi:TrfA protein
MRLTPEQIRQLTPEGRKEFLRASQERVMALARQREEEALKIEEEKNVNLPYWQNERRGTPNAFLRSAMFSVIQGKDRIFLDELVLFSQGDYSISFTGKQLSQEDLTVWQTLVHLARFHSTGTRCIFKGSEILKSIILSDGKENYRLLEESIKRLTIAVIEVKCKKYSYYGHLIHSYTVENATRIYDISLSKDAIKLFSGDDWTGVEWEQRLCLRGKHLAQALHAYYSSHQDPYPVKLSTLQDLTGSKNKQPADFKRKCQAALDELVKINLLENYQIDKNLVTVKRKENLRLNSTKLSVV